mmetsp:Transcript_24287/g.45190  ORF Transcript_24287/g.45190 Transcript_24287/m.45190 type:complete len:202 (-) Transcript_24287:3-608(-)
MHSDGVISEAALKPNTWSRRQLWLGGRAERSTRRMLKLDGTARVLRHRFVIKRKATSESLCGVRPTALASGMSLTRGVRKGPAPTGGRCVSEAACISLVNPNWLRTTSPSSNSKSTRVSGDARSSPAALQKEQFSAKNPSTSSVTGFIPGIVTRFRTRLNESNDTPRGADGASLGPGGATYCANSLRMKPLAFTFTRRLVL